MYDVKRYKVTKREVQNAIRNNGKWSGKVYWETRRNRMYINGDEYRKDQEVVLSTLDELDDLMAGYAYWTWGGNIAFDISFWE